MISPNNTTLNKAQTSFNTADSSVREIVKEIGNFSVMQLEERKDQATVERQIKEELPNSNMRNQRNNFHTKCEVEN